MNGRLPIVYPMTNKPNLPEDIQQFIHRFISSGVQLEVLLLMVAQKQSEWSIAEVSDELRSDPTLIAALLASLQKAGLIAISGSAQEIRYRYAPNSDSLRQQVDTLATLYRERGHSILSAIYGRPVP